MTKHSFKHNLRILNKILKETKKYKPYCVKNECRIDRDFIIIKEIYDKHDKRNGVIKIPVVDLPIIIINYRARLHQLKHKLSKSIDNSIDELNLKDKLNEIIE